MTDPVLPGHPTNPVGQTERIRRSERAIRRDLTRTRDWLVKTWTDLPTQQVPGVRVNRNYYDYLVRLSEIRRIIRELQGRLAETGQDELARNVEGAYRQGTAQAVNNLSKLTDDYTRTVTSVLRSRPWQRRVALAGARVFELMEGFQGKLGGELSRILIQGVEDGQNPRVVAKAINNRFRIGNNRAKRIARTEITGALRRANWDESQDAEDKFGIKQGMLHFSALSPTTRQTHASRHGRIYSINEVRDWYSVDGNAINCKCTQRSVLLDENNEPVIGKKLVDKMAKQRQQFTGKK